MESACWKSSDSEGRKVEGDGGVGGLGGMIPCARRASLLRRKGQESELVGEVWVCSSRSTNVQLGICVDVVDHVAESVSIQARPIQSMEILKYSRLLKLYTLKLYTVERNIIIVISLSPPACGLIRMPSHVTMIRDFEQRFPARAALTSH